MLTHLYWHAAGRPDDARTLCGGIVSKHRQPRKVDCPACCAVEATWWLGIVLPRPISCPTCLGRPPETALNLNQTLRQCDQCGGLGFLSEGSQ
jgi:hypothetical protein